MDHTNYLFFVKAAEIRTFQILFYYKPVIFRSQSLLPFWQLVHSSHSHNPQDSLPLVF